MTSEKPVRPLPWKLSNGVAYHDASLADAYMDWADAEISRLEAALAAKEAEREEFARAVASAAYDCLYTDSIDVVHGEESIGRERMIDIAIAAVLERGSK